MQTITAEDLTSARAIVYRHMAATPTHRWPLLDARLGAAAWVKHENHTPLGAFKVRGGLTYLDALVRSGKKVGGLISATRWRC